VFALDGSLLQTTYVPGGAGLSLIATGPNSTVFVVADAGAIFAPTQADPFPAETIRMTFVLRLSPKASAETLPLACLGNAASYDPAPPIAPGEIVTLMGSGLGPQQGIQTQATLQSSYPTQAAGVEVTFDGTPAPLLWVQDSQINAVAPWSLTPGQNTQVCVTYDNVKTNCLTWPVAQTAQAVFTVDGVYAAALNQDGTVNSATNPAAPGSIVSVWATGLGPITPPQADGTLIGFPLPNDALGFGVWTGSTNPPCATGLGCSVPGPYGMNISVTYAGPAPYQVAGASQINFELLGLYDCWLCGNWFNLYLPSAPLTQSPVFRVYIAGQ